MIKDKSQRYKKSISAIIVMVLLVAISVVIISTILNFSKDFTTKSVEQVDDFKTTIDEDFIGQIIVKRAINNTLFLENTKKDSVFNVRAYRIISNDLDLSLYKLRELDSIQELTYGKIVDIPIICFPGSNFDIELISDQNTSITLKVMVSNYVGDTCVITQDDCPEGYISVPGNSLYDTDRGFCVMKYEAKIDTNSDGLGDGPCRNAKTVSGYSIYNVRITNYWHVSQYDENHHFEEIDPSSLNCPISEGIDYNIVSTAIGAPMINVSQIQSKELCESIGPNYRLINNDQWMTIARNIENIGSNWTSGVVGEGKMKIGNIFNSNDIIYDDSGIPASYFADNIDSGFDRNGLAKYTLSNGSEIWDFSGNVNEWVDESLEESYCNGSVTSESNGDDFDCGVTGESPSLHITRKVQYYDFINLENYGAFEYHDLGPENRSFTGKKGIGQILIVPGYANNSSYYFGSIYNYNEGKYNSSTHAFLRGGSILSGYRTGPFALNLKFSPNAQHLTFFTGFRCVYDPYGVS